MTTDHTTTQLLESLSAEQREVLRLRIVYRLSAEQTALALGISPASVRVIQHHALDAVRALLSHQEQAGWAASGPS
ncbi:sigma factor-like helix-turn-helix DNA-binding protein [Lentzea sp. NPDC006480]|uniref:sigma factor-like helix-turn-helix DNA-binding protein n=1 Tax=Lentzea sp. NPDC006480 TaxID=3157176 RepID=UPI0033B625D4